MKNFVIAIRETETRCRYYVVIESDITTGKAYAYNPEIGCRVITPYKDRDAMQTAHIRNAPYDWMLNFDAETVSVPTDWTK